MQNRFLRPRSEVVCDRATRICYKEGNVDKSDTERVFGERAGDRPTICGTGSALRGSLCQKVA